MRSIIPFLAGIVVALAIGLSVLAADGINHAQNQRNEQVCALDRAIVNVLVRSGKNIPPAAKYDKYRQQQAAEIAEIQQASAC